MTSKLKVNVIADSGDNAIMTSNGSGTLTLNNAALKNTPAFTAILDSDQSIANNTTVKITFTSELLDTDNAFADSRFTVPSGKGGNYLFIAKVRASNFSNTTNLYIYKNGGELNTAFRTTSLSGGNTAFGANTITALVPLVAGDYIEIYGDQNSGGTASLTTKVFQGYKLIGA